MIEIMAVYLALPINLLIAYDATAGLDTSRIACITRSILIKQQFRGPCLAHGFKHLLESVAAREEQQQYGDICLGGILHNNTFSLQRYENSSKSCIFAPKYSI